jgi:hypothetical protein
MCPYSALCFRMYNIPLLSFPPAQLLYPAFTRTSHDSCNVPHNDKRDILYNGLCTVKVSLIQILFLTAVTLVIFYYGFNAHHTYKQTAPTNLAYNTVSDAHICVCYAPKFKCYVNNALIYQICKKSWVITKEYQN